MNQETGEQQIPQAVVVDIKITEKTPQTQTQQLIQSQEDTQENPTQNQTTVQSLGLMKQVSQDQQAYDSQILQSQAQYDGVQIEIVDYSIKVDSVGKYVVYNLKGKDRNGNFETPRRYNDFVTLRASLVSRWPGCYIAPLPPKQAMGNLEKDFIDSRRFYLEKFLVKLSQNSALWYGAETNIFLHSNVPDIGNIFNTLPKIPYDEMITIYETNFESIKGMQIELDLVNSIQQFQLFLKKTVPMLQNFKDIYKNLFSARQAHNDQYSTFVTLLLPEYERTCLLEYCQGTEKAVFSSADNDQYNEIQSKLSSFLKQNEFLKLYDAVKIEQKEIEAFSESFRQREQLENKRTEAQQRLRSYQLEKQEILAGKNSLKQMFISTSKDDQINKLQVKMEQIQKDIDQLNILCNLVSLILGKIEIPAFKIEKELGYFQTIKRIAQFELEFSKVVKQNFDLFKQTEYWQEVLANKFLSTFEQSKSQQ